MSPQTLSEYIEGLPNISGSEGLVAQAMARSGPFYLPQSGIDFGRIRSAFAIALHMHQPLIPAGGGDLHTAPVILTCSRKSCAGVDGATACPHAVPSHSTAPRYAGSSVIRFRLSNTPSSPIARRPWRSVPE